jgi:phage shock protein A
MLLAIFFCTMLVALLGFYVGMLHKKKPTDDEKLDEAVVQGEKAVLSIKKKISQVEASILETGDALREAERSRAKWARLVDAAVGMAKDGKHSKKWLAENAGEAVRKRLEAEQEAEAAKKSVEQASSLAKELNDTLFKARQQLDGIRSSKVSIAARTEAAKIRQGLADSMDENSPASILKKMEDEMLAQEAKASAWEETSSVQRPSVSSLDVDSEVEKLLKPNNGNQS